MKTFCDIVIATLGLLLVAGCQGSAGVQSAPSIPDPRVVSLFGGPELYDALIEPDRVEAFRVGEGVWPEDAKDDSSVTYPEIAGPVVVSKESVELLKARLADPKAYDWEIAKACEFRPGVRFDFMRNDARLQVLVCFSCDELRVLLNGKAGPAEDFDAIRPALLQVARQAFPEDADIQALKP